MMLGVGFEKDVFRTTKKASVKGKQGGVDPEQKQSFNSVTIVDHINDPWSTPTPRRESQVEQDYQKRLPWTEG